MRMLPYIGKGREAFVAMRRRVFGANARLDPYLRLMRADKPTGTWLLLLPCWWGVALAADYFPNLWLMFLFALGAILMRGAGCVINDIYDRDLDRAVTRTRTRPLASGEIELWQALAFLVVLLVLSFGVLNLFNRATVFLGLASLGLVVIYPLMKRVTWWPQLFLGLAFNWGVLMGGSAVTERIDFPHILAYIAGIFWTLGYDTIYAHQDKQDDEKAGIKSTARLFGDKSTAWVALFYALTLIFLGLAGLVEGEKLSFTYAWGLLVAACYMAVQLIIWKPEDPESCARRFNSNRDFGLIVLGAVVIGKLA